MAFDPRRAAVFAQLLADRGTGKPPIASNRVGLGSAPSNIALVKYWGKRDPQLHLPNAPSVSISLGDYGAHTQIRVRPPGDYAMDQDTVVLNGEPVLPETGFYKRLHAYLSEIRCHTQVAYHVEINSQVPIGAGIASSAAGFAALVKALDDLHAWGLDPAECAQLARLGSGSATRSCTPGFVWWPVGEAPDGSDSYGIPLSPAADWSALRVGLLIWHNQPKAWSSREAMAHTQQTSPFYGVWPALAIHDTAAMCTAIAAGDFDQMGALAEHNAMALHAMIRSARPGLVYDRPETVAAQHRIWALRAQSGISCYFTQDAGPNLKLLFLEPDTDAIRAAFPTIQIIHPRL